MPSSVKSIDTGIMDEPPIRIWLEEFVRPAPAYEERPGRWVAEPCWPSPRIRPRQWFLNVLSLGERPEAEDRVHVRSPQTAGLAAGDWYGFGAEGESPVDQREDDGKSMIFDSDPLTERVEILGTPLVNLELAVDRPVAYIIVRLNDVDSDGASTRVTYGVLNLTHRNGHEFPEPLEPGRRYPVRLALSDTAYAFPEGHTIRLAISTSYWPVVWPAPEPVKLTLFTGASTVELPERPPNDADAVLRRFDPPERGPRRAARSLEMTPLRRTVERDLTTGNTVYRVFSDSGEFDGAALAHIEDIDLTVGYTIEKAYRIGEYDPGSAEVVIEQEMVHRRHDWSTRLHCVVHLTVDNGNFRLRATMTAYDNDEVFVAREWDELIPRLLV